MPGHRGVFLTPTGWGTRPITGWLVEEAVSIDEETGRIDSDDDEGPGNRPRRLRAAVSRTDGEPEAAASVMNFWCALSPEDFDPTTEKELLARSTKDAALAASIRRDLAALRRLV